MRPVSEARDVYVRRRLTALGTVGVVALAAGVLVGAGGGSGGRGSAQSSASAERKAPPTLPRGGRRIFPDRRVVAYYGAPQDRELGALGIGTPDQAAARLERAARPFAQRRRPVLPAFELLATVANRDAGTDGLYRTRQDDRTIRRYLPPRAATRPCCCSTSSLATPTSWTRRATSGAGCASPTSAWPWTPSGTRPARCPGRRSGP